MLTDLLHSLNTIWTQPDWEKTYVSHTYGLSGLFADDQFTRNVHSLVKSFEEELVSIGGGGSAEVEGCSSVSSCTLSKLILTLVLQVNNYHKSFVHLAGNMVVHRDQCVLIFK